MYQLAYISKANNEFTLDELTDLSIDAGMRNRQIDVTGMLVYHQGVFLQFLEGNEHTIGDLYQRIANDPRHSDCQIIYTNEATTRLFSNWFTHYLSFEYIKEITGEELAGDIAELLAGEVEDQEHVERVLNKFTSIVSSRQSD